MRSPATGMQVPYYRIILPQVVMILMVGFSSTQAGLTISGKDALKKIFIKKKEKIFRELFARRNKTNPCLPFHVHKILSGIFSCISGFFFNSEPSGTILLGLKVLRTIRFYPDYRHH